MIHRMTNVLWVTGILACATACAPGSIDADDFEKSCRTDDECIIVWEGSVCEAGEPASIHQSAKEAFEDKKREMQKRCSGDLEARRVSRTYDASQCIQGQCTFVDDPESISDAGADVKSDR